MTPSWYDLLDIAPDADETTIRGAWRDSIASLDPTDRRFRVLNQAAEVLLDPARRRAHDEQLAAEAEQLDSDELEAPTPTTDLAPSVPQASPPVDQPQAARAPKAPKVPKPKEPKGPKKARTPREPGAGVRVRVPAALIVLVGLLTLAAVAAAAYAFTRPNPAAIEAGAVQAEAAAESAVVPLLSYDATDMDASQRAADVYLTPDYASKSYDPFFAQLKANAPGTGVKVTATVLGSAITTAQDGLVTVLVLVDQSSTNKLNKVPQVAHDFVTVTMEKQGQQWLVSKLVSTPASDA